MSGIAYDGSPFDPKEHPFKEPQENTLEGDKHLSEAFMSMTSTYNVDHLDIATINMALVRSANALAAATQELKEEMRALSEIESRAKHEYNVALVLVSGGTEKSRIASAEIISEEWTNEVRLRQARVQELKNLCGSIRASLDTYQAVSNNLRAEMKVL